VFDIVPLRPDSLCEWKEVPAVGDPVACVSFRETRASSSSELPAGVSPAPESRTG